MNEKSAASEYEFLESQLKTKWKNVYQADEIVAEKQVSLSIFCVFYPMIDVDERGQEGW